MAINLRGTKEAPLTHDELDQNFREFFYSGSVDASELKLFRSQSIDPSFSIPFTTPNGLDKYIQIRSGSDLSGSGAVFTGSQNFTFDYDNHVLDVTGSSNFQGNVNVDGTVTAKSFITTTISSSVILSSGSTIFGNTEDDTHQYTGSVRVSNGITGSLLSTNGVLSSSAQIAADISGSTGTLSASLATDIALRALTSNISGSFTSTSASLASSININSSSIALLSSSHLAFSESVSSSYLRNTTDTLVGDLTVTGTLTSTELVTNIVSSSITLTTGSNIFGDQSIDTHEFTGSVTISSSLDVNGVLSLPDLTNVSASLAAAVAGTGIQNVVEDTTPQLGGNLQLNSNNINGTGQIAIGGSISGSIIEAGTSITGSSLLVNGAINATGDITAYYSSDERLKDNITPLSNALDKINQIGGYEFDWNSNSSHSGHDVGVIAQEIEKVLPEVVVDRDTGYKAVRYEKIVALLINAIKEQQLQIDELKSKL